MDISIIGIDLAKRVFRVHAADDQGSKLLKRRFTRPQLMAFLAQIPATTVAMEACATSHFRGRYCQSFGHEVRIVPAQYVKAFVKRHKKMPSMLKPSVRLHRGETCALCRRSRNCSKACKPSIEFGIGVNETAPPWRMKFAGYSQNLA